MPHTSRKRQQKQQAVTKRREVTSEDGWTHVVGRAGKTSQANVTERLGNDPRGPFPTDLTLPEVRLAKDKIQAAWNASQACQEIQTQIRNLAENGQVSAVTKSVCLGLGSLSAPNFEWRRTSMWQLMVFVTIVEELRCVGFNTKVYAQDPVFNDIDTLFLLELGITVLADPEAFQVIDSSTFLFCAHLVMELSIKALRHGPVSILVDHDFDKLRQGTSSWTLNASAEETQLLERFTQEHESLALPQGGSQVSGLYALRLYWKRETGMETGQ